MLAIAKLAKPVPKFRELAAVRSVQRRRGRKQFRWRRAIGKSDAISNLHITHDERFVLDGVEHGERAEHVLVDVFSLAGFKAMERALRECREAFALS